MTDDLISAIQSFTLAARTALETEAGQQLEGIYGWLPDGTFGDAKGYPALAQIDEAKETRRRLEQFAGDEQAAGLAPKDARRKLLRETAFTWLNRLTAFRLLEERKLLKQTISRLEKSNAFIFWLVEDANAAAKAEFDRGALPRNAMGEGPSELAYRQFLLAQCASLAAEVSILFDPTNLASRLCPRPGVLKELVEAISTADLADAWKPGNEETIGWLYQAFVSQELQAAFAAAKADKKKFEAADIPAVTQLFTIRWVVRFLVENTLGRLWVEMHPDSRLATQLGYLVPVTGRQRALKPVRDISFLDPCCGSMHFGLVAFDVFVEMYREELENAGKPGWPGKASAASEDEIPSSIVAHNLFGIDLDLRAIQLSALAIFQRARSLNPKCKFTDENFACANVEAITGGRLEELISATNFGNRVEERILRALAVKVADSPNLGSLLRLERDLTTLVDAERKKLVSSSQPELLLAGLTEDLFTSTRDLNAFFDQLAESIATRLDAFARDVGSKSSHTAGEAAKGLRFLRLAQRRYDVVVTNPPYLSRRKMNERLAALLEEQYPEGKTDLLAAFIIRCQELLASEGLMGMLTMHSFMFIGTYEDMRARLRGETAIETLAHFGGGLFAVGNPGTLQTAAFVLRRESQAGSRDKQVGTYFRLVNERDAETKRLALESALSALRDGNDHPLLFRYEQSKFDAITAKPWVYFINSRIRDLFALPSLDKLALPRIGGKTSENFRFLRLWWEVGAPRVDRACKSHDQAAKSSATWFPYAKGGIPTRWFGNYLTVVNWNGDGQEIKEVINEKRKKYSPNARGALWSAWLNSYDYYFKQGIIYSFTSSKSFSARLLPAGFIFDVSASAVFTSNNELVLGVLNSRIGEFLLYALNPTLSTQIGDLCRLPIPDEKSEELNAAVSETIERVQAHYSCSELTHSFVRPLFGSDELTKYQGIISELQVRIDSEIFKLYRLGAEELGIIDRELSGPAVSSGEDDTDNGTEFSDEDNESDIPIDVSPTDWARSWISYTFGIVLDRFEIGKPGGFGCGDFDPQIVTAIRPLIDPDGVMVAEKDHPQDIVRRAVQCLEAMRGRETAHALIRTATGETSGDPEDLLRGWLDRFTGQPADSFWKYHHQLYRKRPVYWPLQSPKKKFTVWLFQERLTKDSLFTVKKLVDDQLRLVERSVADLRPEAQTNRAKAKDLDKLLEHVDDLREFSQRINSIIQRGYPPHPDDGVLLNAAPLWELLPSWPETKKAWQELEAGKYDWAQQAMEYWPVRVKQACQNNKSFAIAHGLA